MEIVKEMSNKMFFNESIQSLRVCAPAKINLHLEILGMRDDGFHELAMLMQSIDLFDEIEFIKTNNRQIRLTSNDNTLSNDNNFIIKAAKALLKSSFGNNFEL